MAAERAQKVLVAGATGYIGGLLFLSTVINYIDRQTLSVLAPYIKEEHNWSNSDFALLIIAFQDRIAEFVLGPAWAEGGRRGCSDSAGTRLPVAA